MLLIGVNTEGYFIFVSKFLSHSVDVGIDRNIVIISFLHKELVKKKFTSKLCITEKTGY